MADSGNNEISHFLIWKNPGFVDRKNSITIG